METAKNVGQYIHTIVGLDDFLPLPTVDESARWSKEYLFDSARVCGRKLGTYNFT